MRPVQVVGLTAQPSLGYSALAWGWGVGVLLAAQWLALPRGVLGIAAYWAGVAASWLHGL